MAAPYHIEQLEHAQLHGDHAREQQGLGRREQPLLASQAGRAQLGRELAISRELAQQSEHGHRGPARAHAAS